MNQELAEFEKEIKALRGAEFKMDFTYHPEGHIVKCFVAQADLDVGVTVRGGCPWGRTDDDVDNWCIGRHQIGRAFGNYSYYTEDNYHEGILRIMQAVQEGVYIVPGMEDGSGSVSCAF